MKKEEERQRAILLRLARMQSPASGPESFFPSGFRALDDALGGGFPRGRIVELFGPSGCGKTTLAIQCVARAQKDGLTAAWIDADHTFDPAYATRLGVDTERVPFAQPASAEQGLEIARTLAGSGAVDLVVVDSAAALVPQLELEAGIGDDAPGLHGRVLASGLRKLRQTLDALRRVCPVSQPNAQPAGGIGGRRRNQRRRIAAQTFRRCAHRFDPIRGCPAGVANAEK